MQQHEPAIADLEAALALEPNRPTPGNLLAMCRNNRAWELASGPESGDLPRALRLVKQAAESDPEHGVFLNTLGVVQYRLGRYDAAIATLSRSLAANHGRSEGFDLLFLAMAHHRLGHPGEARACYDRAVRWIGAPARLERAKRQGTGRLPSRSPGRAGRPARSFPGERLRRSTVEDSAAASSSQGGVAQHPHDAPLAKPVEGNAPYVDKPPRRAVITIGPHVVGSRRRRALSRAS